MYISIREAALRWGITERRVQELCKSGAIDGATRLGRAWMIPASAEKPKDRRSRPAHKEAPPLSPDLPAHNPFIMHSALYHTPGTADHIIEQLKASDPALAALAMAQIDYLRGDIDSAVVYAGQLLAEEPAFGLRLAAVSLLSMHAMWSGDLPAWRDAHRLFDETVCKNDLERCLLNLRLAADASAIYDASAFPDWFRGGAFDRLPKDYFSSIRGFYVKYLYICAYELACGRLVLEDVRGLALMRTLPYIIEPILSQTRIEQTLLPEIYILLIAATVYHNLDQKERAAAHLDRAITLCLPDRLYTPLVEYRTGLDTLLDERLALYDNAALRRVRELHRRMSEGQIKLHNQFLGREFSPTLTTREREVAKLAVFGVSNAEIAKRLNIELHSVKHYIYTAMNKVGVNKRAELGLFI